MATIFKRKAGKHVPYTIQYVDHLGRRRTKKGFTDKGLTEQLAAKLESDARMRSTGLIDAEQERMSEVLQSPLDEHVNAFQESISERSPKYIQHTMSRLKRILAGTGIRRLADIQSEDVLRFLKSLRKTEDLSPRTFNHYVQAIDCFCNWCVYTNRMNRNPLIGIERLNTEIDVRHKRRALTSDEFEKLVASARQSGVSIQKFTGEARARIYLLSYMTGLRQRELGSLTPRSFDLLSDLPTVTIEAMASKHKKKDLLPIHPELAAVLPTWFSGLRPTEKLFPGLERKKAWLMIKKDLERAGVPYVTEDGYADFHACRHTHITDLLRHGVTLPEAQKLARHSDIKMTMKYTHIGLGDQALAVAVLPTSALHGRCISGGVRSPAMTSPGTTSSKRKRPNPCRNRSLGVVCPPVSFPGKVEAGGLHVCSFAYF